MITDAKKNKEEKKDEVKTRLSKPKIAIFHSLFKQTTLFSPLTPQTYIKCWKKNDIVRDEKDIELLLGLGAPLQVYVEDDGIY